VPISRPAAVLVAAGLLAAALGLAGLLTRHSGPAVRPPPLGVATVPAPAGPVATSWQASLPAPPATGTSRPTTGPLRARYPQQVQPQRVARPVSLTIPLIGVRTALITLGRAADGSLQVPSSTSVAGWYADGPRPGAIGPAVIAGHVDSLSGPGVFFRLSQLRPGDRVYVTRADGTTAEFLVTAAATYLKDDFPAQAVYGGTPDAELRLITCGGTFDQATGHYLSNIIVYATEVA
jgi:sortase (surface protein transpeptidase)